MNFQKLALLALICCVSTSCSNEDEKLQKELDRIESELNQTANWIDAEQQKSQQSDFSSYDALLEEERNRVLWENEKTRLETLERATEFYQEIMNEHSQE